MSTFALVVGDSVTTAKEAYAVRGVVAASMANKLRAAAAMMAYHSPPEVVFLCAVVDEACFTLPVVWARNVLAEEAEDEEEAAQLVLAKEDVAEVIDHLS